jgi:hypothetical protein
MAARARKVAAALLAAALAIGAAAAAASEGSRFMTSSTAEANHVTFGRPLVAFHSAKDDKTRRPAAQLRRRPHREGRHRAGSRGAARPPEERLEAMKIKIIYCAV